MLCVMYISGLPLSVPNSPRIDAVIPYLGQCEKLLRDGKLRTSSIFDFQSTPRFYGLLDFDMLIVDTGSPKETKYSSRSRCTKM
jgi:hypothetical protein